MKVQALKTSIDFRVIQDAVFEATAPDVIRGGKNDKILMQGPYKTAYLIMSQATLDLLAETSPSCVNHCFALAPAACLFGCPIAVHEGLPLGTIEIR